MSNPLKKLLDRSKIQEQVRSDRTKVFVEKYQSCDSEHVWCVGLPKLYTRDTCPQEWFYLIIVPVTYNTERVTEDRVFERYQKNTISAEGIVPHESYILRQVHKVSGGS